MIKKAITCSKEKNIAEVSQENRDLVDKIIENIKIVGRLREEKNELYFSESFLTENGQIVKRLHELSGLTQE